MTVVTVTQDPGDGRRTVACHGTPLLMVVMVVTLVMVVMMVTLVMVVKLLMVVTLLMVVMMVTPWMVWRVQGRELPAM